MRPTFRALPAVLALVLAAGLAPSSMDRSVGGSLALANEQHPTNAGAIFNWGHSHWDDEFTEPSGHVRKTWHVNRPGQVSLQHGQLTLNAGRRGDVVVTAMDQAASTGRWVARVRSRAYAAPGARYQVNWELVPAAPRAYHCGAQSIQMARYRIGSHVAKGAVRTLPRHSFGFGKKLNLGPDVYHTYAIEVTRRHISWFVDTHVIRTERRPAALSGVRLRPQFRLAAVPHRRMKPSRMQMDWVRYYTLARHDARSIDAPPMHRGTYGKAC